MKLDPKSQTNWEEVPVLDPFKLREERKKMELEDEKIMPWLMAYFEKVFFYFFYFC